MIDDAMLRPGRLEIHLEIGLPDENGRKQIFEIHTKSARANNLIDSEVDFNYLAQNTKNYTGAEIEAVCRSATSFALFKNIDLIRLWKEEEKKKESKDGLGNSKREENKIRMSDFKLAL